jgi:hypothetical protein
MVPYLLAATAILIAKETHPVVGFIFFIVSIAIVLAVLKLAFLLF